MKEKLLQEIWNNKAFNPINLKDTEGNPIEILEFGTLNPNSGPDFLSAKIRFKDLIFFGNIEIHTKSSDWYLHQHHTQKEYQSIILHIVFENDKDISELRNRNIPTLELKNYISVELLESNSSFFQFIPCEDIFDIRKIPEHFSKEIILKKLEEKDKEIQQMLTSTRNDYEAVLFQKIAYAFGLKINSDVFLQIAQNIGFNIIKKVIQNPFQSEALLLGKAGLLHSDAQECEKWRKECNFLKTKFKLNDVEVPAKFLRLRPISFPTIRLSQLSQLYYHHQNLFSKIINAEKVEDIKILFKNIKTSEYWENHFVFGKESLKSTKKLSSDFVDIVLINAIFPIIYSYHKNNPIVINKVINFYQNTKAEQNNIIKQWKNLGAEIHTALDSQCFLYLYKNYCSKKKCTECHQIK